MSGEVKLGEADYTAFWERLLFMSNMLCQISGKGLLMPTAFSKLFAVGKSLKNEVRNAKRAWLIKWSIMRIFNEGRTSMIELVWDFRVINVLAKFENVPWKIMDVRVLTVMFHVRCWKMPKKFAIFFFWQLCINPEFILITIISPTIVPNLVTLAKKMSSGMPKEVGSLNGPLCAYLMRQNLHDQTCPRS